MEYMQPIPEVVNKTTTHNTCLDDILLSLPDSTSPSAPTVVNECVAHTEPPSRTSGTLVIISPPVVSSPSSVPSVSVPPKRRSTRSPA